MPAVLHDLWRVTGGVVDRWNEPGTWVCNQNSVLTVELAATVAAELVADAAAARSTRSTGFRRRRT